MQGRDLHVYIERAWFKFLDAPPDVTSYCGRPLEPLASSAAPEESAAYNREIRIFLPNKQRQHRTVHIQKDVRPSALC